LVRPTRKLGRAALQRFLSGLAPGGVYRATPVTRCAGGLLHHRFTLAALARGGLFSVALSRGSPRVGVTHRPALRSPDVPRRVPAAGPAHPPLEYRAGVEDPLRVERPLDPPVAVDDGVADVPGQPGLLGAPDAVLAGDRAAQPDREVHHLAVGGLGVLLLREV